MSNLSSAAEIILSRSRNAAMEGGKRRHDQEVARLWAEYRETPFYTIYILIKDVPHYRGSYLGIEGLREHFIQKEIARSLHVVAVRDTAIATVNEHLPEGLSLAPGFRCSFAYVTDDSGRWYTYVVVSERITRVMDHIFLLNGDPRGAH